jgi:hypothetical protein
LFFRCGLRDTWGIYIPTEGRKPGLRWEKLTAISSAVLALIGLVGTLFVIVQIRDARDAIRVQHLDELSKEFDDVQIAAVRKSLALHRLDAKQETIRLLDPEDEPAEIKSTSKFLRACGPVDKQGILG